MSDELTVEPSPVTRLCLLCERECVVIKTVGGIAIKERCPNTCLTGYVRAFKQSQAKERSSK